MALTRAAGLRGDSPLSLRESDENCATILSLVFQDNAFEFSFLKWGQSITKRREMTGRLPEAWQTHFISAGFLRAHRRRQLFRVGCAAGQQVWREAPACEPGVGLYEYVRVKRIMDSFLTGIHTYHRIGAKYHRDFKISVYGGVNKKKLINYVSFSLAYILALLPFSKRFHKLIALFRSRLLLGKWSWKK